MTQKMGIGAQFGGKYFCHDVRVIRLPRHGASCPVGLGVSCSADRQCMGKITKDGVFIEELESDPSKYLPEVIEDSLSTDVVRVDLTRPMAEIQALLTKHPIRTRLSLSGPLVVARDIAHAKIQERLDSGEGMPQYLKDLAVYYRGPNGELRERLVMLAMGNRSKAVKKESKALGGSVVNQPSWTKIPLRKLRSFKSKH
jgi:fumarate hydratase class I